MMGQAWEKGEQYFQYWIKQCKKKGSLIFKWYQ